MSVLLDRRSLGACLGLDGLLNEIANTAQQDAKTGVANQRVLEESILFERSGNFQINAHL